MFACGSQVLVAFSKHHLNSVQRREEERQTQLEKQEDGERERDFLGAGGGGGGLRLEARNRRTSRLTTARSSSLRG